MKELTASCSTSVIVRVTAGLVVLASPVVVTAQQTEAYRVDLLLTTGDSPPQYSVNSGLWFALPEDKNPLTITLRYGAHGSVWIRDYNPIFFQYKDGSDSTQIPDVDAVNEFAKALGTAFKSGAATAAAIPARPVTSTRTVPPVCAVLLNGIVLNDLISTADDAKTFLTKTLRESVFSPLTSPEQIKFDSLTLPENRLRTAALSARKAITSDVLQNLSTLKGELATLRQTKAITLTCINASTDGQTTKSSAGIDGLIAQLITPPKSDQFTPANLGDIVKKLSNLSSLINSAQNSDSALSQILDLLKSLQKDLDDVGKPHEISTDIAFDATHISTRSVSISWNTKYDPLFVVSGDDDDRTKNQQVASRYSKYVVSFPPHRSYHIGASVAAVYSFVRNPDYAAKTSNGQLVISQTTNDYNKLTAAVAINITPDRVFNEFAQPHFEIGVVPDSAKFGLFAGVGLTFLSSNQGTTSTLGTPAVAFPGLEFNAGIVYQKINELGSGLSVGQVVATTDALKINSSLKAGLYISVGLKMK